MVEAVAEAVIRSGMLHTFGLADVIYDGRRSDPQPRVPRLRLCPGYESIIDAESITGARVMASCPVCRRRVAGAFWAGEFRIGRHPRHRRSH